MNVRLARVSAGIRPIVRCGLFAAAFVGAAAFLPGTVSAKEGEAVSTESDEEKTPPRVEAIDPPSQEALQAAIDRGVAFLVADQNADGSWGSATHTKDLDIYAPIPGAHHAFRTGTTALCISALIDVEADSPEAKQALVRAEAWLIDQLPRLRRATPDALYNVWGHAYSIQALVRMHRKEERTERKEQIAALIAEQFDKLDRYESVDGGWGYYDFKVGSQKPATDSTSFVNAAVLVAYADARDAGFEPPSRTVERAVKATQRQRKPDFSYLYGEYLKDYPLAPINCPPGSLGRSQACNVALLKWGDKKVTEEVLETWLHRLFARNYWLSIGRKRPIPHESYAQVAGYFYYFGHYYGALCIEELPEEKRDFFRAHLAKTLMALQEKDGSWWDYPLYAYHRPYGTGFALQSLAPSRK
jgi:hypothetical protein